MLLMILVTVANAQLMVDPYRITNRNLTYPPVPAGQIQSYDLTMRDRPKKQICEIEKTYYSMDWPKIRCKKFQYDGTVLRLTDCVKGMELVSPTNVVTEAKGVCSK